MCAQRPRAHLCYSSDAVEYFWLLHHNVEVLLVKSVYLLFFELICFPILLLINLYDGWFLLLNWLRLLLLNQRLSLFCSRSRGDQCRLYIRLLNSGGWGDLSLLQNGRRYWWCREIVRELHLSLHPRLLLVRLPVHKLWGQAYTIHTLRTWWQWGELTIHTGWHHTKTCWAAILLSILRHHRVTIVIHLACRYALRHSWQHLTIHISIVATLGNCYGLLVRTQLMGSLSTRITHLMRLCNTAVLSDLLGRLAAKLSLTLISRGG